MSLASYLKSALYLAYRGEWREFVFRLRVHLQGIDLKNSYLEELNLPGERCHHYANSGGLHLERVIRTLKVTSQDAIVDFGSGKGGALITLARFPFASILGVEISPELTAIARRNLGRLGIHNATMKVCDAVEYTELDDYNHFYFFNPFPLPVMTAVMRNICASLARAPREAKIIYFNPQFHDAVLADSPFSKVAEFHHHELGYYLYSNRP